MTSDFLRMDPRSIPAMISVPNPPITSIGPSDFRQYKLSSPEVPKSPQRPESLSPVTSPSTLPPTNMTMVSMASMFSRPPFPGGFPGAPFPSGFASKDYPRMPDEYANMHRLMQERPFSRSPTPIISPNDPMANDCKIVDFKGEKIAAFIINGKTMLCLPQAFELFLKNLVGGLHTVYTKLKRLEITPIVCNVEQVRILRGLGAIQPGVNRCKLLANSDFELLYKDCTTSRPPKRVMPFPPMSPQDALLRLNHPMGHPSPGEPFRDSSFHKDAGFDRPMFHGPLPPPMNPIGAAHFMALNNPAAAQAALLSRTTGIPNMGTIPLPGSSPESLLESYKQSYGDMLKHLQGLHKSQDIEKDDGSESKEHHNDENNSSVLNLSQPHSEHQDDSLKSDSDIGEPDIGASEDEMDYDDKPTINNKDPEIAPILEAGKMGSMFNMMNHIQSLINTAVENAKMEEKQLLTEKSDLQGELLKEKDSHKILRKQIEEETKTTDLYLRRFRKEKKLRRKLQEQLDMETKKIQKLEAALKSVSYETLIQIKESIAKEAALKEKERQEHINGASLNSIVTEAQATNGSPEHSRISNSSSHLTNSSLSSSVLAPVITTSYR